MSDMRTKQGLKHLMPQVRCIQHFKLQNTLHQRMLKASIVNKIELHCSKYCKNNNNILITFPRNLSLLHHFSVYLLSLRSLFLIRSLLSSNPTIIFLPTSHITVEKTLIQVDQRWRKRLPSLSSFYLSHPLSPLFRPNHNLPPNITHHSGENVDLG